MTLSQKRQAGAEEKIESILREFCDLPKYTAETLAGEFVDLVRDEIESALSSRPPAQGERIAQETR